MILAQPCVGAQRAHLFRRDEARPQQPVTEKHGVPLAVGEIALLARQIACVRAVKEQRREARALELVVDGDPIDARGLESHLAHAVRGQPRGRAGAAPRWWCQRPRPACRPSRRECSSRPDRARRTLEGSCRVDGFCACAYSFWYGCEWKPGAPGGAREAQTRCQTGSPEAGRRSKAAARRVSPDQKSRPHGTSLRNGQEPCDPAPSRERSRCTPDSRRHLGSSRTKNHACVFGPSG